MSPIFTRREKLRHFVEANYFQRFIIILILINAVTLGLETDRDIMASIGGGIKILDNAIR